MKSGVLTNQEKITIQNKISKGVSIEDIADTLDRSVSEISKYIDGELDRIISTIAKVKTESLLSEELENTNKKAPKSRYASPKKSDVSTVDKPKKSKVKKEEKQDEIEVVSTEVLKEVRKMLLDAGLTSLDTDRIVNSAISVAQKEGVKYDEVKRFYTACIKRMNAGHFIQKTTSSGKGGVAIMSGAASMKMDEASKRARTSRSAKGHIYNPSSGKIVQ